MSLRKGGALDFTKRRRRSNLHSSVCLRPNATESRDASQIQHILRLKQLLLHRRDQIGSSGQYSNVGRMFGEMTDRLIDRPRPE